MDFKAEELATNTFIAAFAGALLGLKAWPGGSWPEKFFNIFLGFVIGMIGGPGLAEYFGVTSPRIAAFITLLLGGAGLVLFGALIEGIRQTQFGAFIGAGLNKFFPGAYKPREDSTPGGK